MSEEKIFEMFSICISHIVALPTGGIFIYMFFDQYIEKNIFDTFSFVMFFTMIFWFFPL